MILLLTILVPLLAALVVLVRPAKAAWIGLAGGTLALVGALVLWLSIPEDGFHQVTWSGLPGLPFVLIADNFTMMLLLVVTSVACFIFIYSRGYMAPEPGKTAFWSVMNLFLAAMLLLVLSGDWISFVIGWEIMGFASYRLIATWHDQPGAQVGANKAFMMTRVTDMGLYLGIFAIILISGSSAISAQPVHQLYVWAGLALLVAVMGKSAQVPFQSWLSGAMAGPTPVSSLLHSATLVAAGLILLLKAFPLLPVSVLPWIGAAGSITIILAGLTAVFSDDLKQMLAASTSSQLGFMLLAIAAGYPGAAAAHLIAHAFMKSSLFLGAGIWQHAYHSTRFDDIKAGGRKFKVTFYGFALAALALAGIPPLVGYFSKDAVIAAGFKTDPAFWYVAAALAGALLTAIYMARSARILWKSKGNAPEKIHLLNWMRAGMGLLILLVLAGGLILQLVIQRMDFELPHSTAAIISGLVVALAGLGIGWFLMPDHFRSKTTTFIRGHYSLAGGYRALIVKPVLQLAYYFNRFEKGIDYIIMGTGSLFFNISKTSHRLDNFLDKLVSLVGTVNLGAGRLARWLDDQGLEKSLYQLTVSVRQMGQQGRRLQSGLVHQEMMWSVVGFISFLVILIISIL